MPKLYTVREVAGIFRRSSKTIYRWIDEGKIFKEIIYLNGGYLVTATEIERILEEGKIPPLD